MHKHYTSHPCEPGFECINLDAGYECRDINECLLAPCLSGFDCVNQDGSFTCFDIDECEEQTAPCLIGFECQNHRGSYNCSDIDECNQSHSACEDDMNYDCINTQGSDV